jgi:thioesterase domain-containing protein
LAALFQAPTVAGFAALLSGRSEQPSAPSLIVLRPAATDPPLVLIHPAGGDLMAYARLVAALPPGRELLGVQSRALSGEPEHDSVAAMAAAYARAIRDRQPAGPYLLAGWSMGGVLAVEVASVIEAAGEKVALLVLIDASVPGALAEDPLLAPAVALAGSVSSFTLTPADAAALRQQLSGRSLDERLRLLAAWVDERGLRAADREPDEVFRRQAELAAHHERLLVGHRAPVVAAPLTVVWAADVLHERRMDWASHTRAGIRAETTLPGNHFTLLRPPNVAAVGAHLAAAAAAATSRSTVEYEATAK